MRKNKTENRSQRLSFEELLHNPNIKINDNIKNKTNIVHQAT